jgi:hypothetical protein
MFVYMIIVQAYEMDLQTIKYKCPECKDTHYVGAQFDPFHNRTIIEGFSCGEGNLCICVTDNTVRRLPPNVMKKYEENSKKENCLKAYCKGLELKYARYGRRYLSKV